MLSKSKSTNGKRLGLSGQLLLGFVVPVVVILVVLGVLICTRMLSTITAMENKNISSQVDAATTQIQSYFEKDFVTVQFLADRIAINDVLWDAANAGQGYSFISSASYASALDTLATANGIAGDNVFTTWICSTVTNQVLQGDGFLSDSTYDITTTSWYQKIQQNGNKIIVSDPYKDSSTNNEYVVSVVMPVYNEQDTMIGVVGVDVALEMLSNYLATLTVGEKGYVTVYDSEKNILYHPDASLVGVNLASVVYSDNMLQAVQGNQSTEVMEYNRGEDKYYGATNYLADIEWLVLGCMPEIEFVQQTTAVTWTIVIGFILCIVALVAICIHRARLMVQPLRILGEASSKFVHGDLHIQSEYDKNDEIGDLTFAFTQAGQGLSHIISDISHVLSEITNKNLTVETNATYEGDFVQIQESLHGIIDRMNTIMQVINQTADQVAIGADHVSAGAQMLAQGSTEQASSVQELATTIEEVYNKMQVMSEHAQDASSKANHVGNDVQESSEKMQLMVQAMARISETSNEIQKIIKAIEDIAFQTNILALNAAVEAARAGNAGKGFAVVADEVRNLASKSAEASQNTATLIANSLAAVQDGIELAEAASQSLLMAVGDVQGVAQSIGGVSDELLHHADAMQQLTTGVTQISSVVQTNSATAEESAAASQELSAQATNLKNLMREFRFKN